MDNSIESLLGVVEATFENKSISTDVLLSGVKVLDATSKSSPAFNDPRYLPFYCRLGCVFKPKQVIQIGPKLGLVGASFLKGCRTTEKWTVIGDNQSVSSIVASNLKLDRELNIEFWQLNDFLKVKDILLKDMALLSEPYDKIFDHLEFLWSQLRPEGLLVIDYIQNDVINEAFLSFCRVKNREPKLFNTRYGVGIIKR